MATKPLPVVLGLAMAVTTLALDNGLSDKPPMGVSKMLSCCFPAAVNEVTPDSPCVSAQWNTWNNFSCDSEFPGDWTGWQRGSCICSSRHHPAWHPQFTCLVVCCCCVQSMRRSSGLQQTGWWSLALRQQATIT